MSTQTVLAITAVLALGSGCLLGTSEESGEVSCDTGGCGDDVIVDGPDAGPPASEEEVCGDGFDDDGDGDVDEGCPCRLGDRQSCYPGDPALAGVGVCELGQQTCVETEGGLAWSACKGAMLPSTEICDGRDSDCNGVVDDRESGIACEAEVAFDGADCRTVACPADQPYPVGCEVTMEGGDSRGCVAPTSGGSALFFKEGDKCGSGGVAGTVYCSAVPDGALDASSCPMNKPNPRYPPSPSGCPD